MLDSERKARKSELHRKWRLKNIERRRIYKREWARNHKDSVRRTFLRWISKNKEAQRQHGREYYLSHKSACNKRSRAYHRKTYMVNRERIIKATKEYAIAHPQIRRKCRQNWERNHPEKYKAHNKASNTARKARMRGAKIGCKRVNALISEWRLEPDFECSYCNHRFQTTVLHIDHIIPISKGGTHSVDNICRSCPSCNMSKGSKLPQDLKSLSLTQLSQMDQSPTNTAPVS